jgi:voltage-gated potassium channel
MHRHHRAAVATVAAAVVLDTGLGVAFAAADHISAADGLYWATTTATTVGYGDITPHGWAAHVIAVGVMLTVIPLFAATFSLLTSGLAGGDLHTGLTAAEQRIKDHTEARLRHHLKGAAGEPTL